MPYYPIKPVPKPRMTQRDKWKNRKCVDEYRAFKDLCRLHRVAVPECGAVVIFHIPMPPSWSKKQRVEMNGKPHQQRPDIDNLLKGLLDAVLAEDCTVWNITAEKRWATEGGIDLS